MPTIISNCKFHPNELVACNDTRLAQNPLILKQAQEEQKNAEELQIRDLKFNFSSKLKENATSLIIFDVPKIALQLLHVRQKCGHFKMIVRCHHRHIIIVKASSLSVILNNIIF